MKKSILACAAVLSMSLISCVHLLSVSVEAEFASDGSCWFAIRGDTVRGRVLDTETVDYGILNQKLFQIECGTDRSLFVESFTLAFEGPTNASELKSVALSDDPTDRPYYGFLAEHPKIARRSLVSDGGLVVVDRVDGALRIHVKGKGHLIRHT